MSTPNITDYDNFRSYLQDLYKFKKQTISKYSYRRLAEDLGFTPTNFLHLVISEKKNLSEEAIVKICKHIPWTAL